MQKGSKSVHVSSDKHPVKEQGICNKRKNTQNTKRKYKKELGKSDEKLK